jgi:hypothetical protein
MGGDVAEDDPEWLAAESLESLLAGSSEAQRIARIRAFSDETLSHYYAMLSDTQVIVNVPALPLLEAEMKARGLALVGKH